MSNSSESQNLIVGCGYVGRRVANRWVSDNQSVSALTRSNSRTTEFQTSGIQPILGDVTDAGSLAKLPGCDVLVFAVGFDRTAAPDKRTVYVQGLKNTLRAVAGSKPHVVYVSSISVYGQSNGEWIDETSECEPTTDGGRICLDAESTLREECAQAEMPCTILRLAGIYGPGRLLRRVDSLKNSEPIGGNPDAWLNLIHGDDAAAAVVAAAKKNAADSNGNSEPCEVYVVSDDRPIKRCEYFSSLAARVSAPEPTFDANAHSNRPPRPGLNKRCRNDCLKKHLLPELQFPDISTGIAHAVEG